MVVDHGSVNGSPRPARLHRCQPAAALGFVRWPYLYPFCPRAIPAVSATAAVAVRLKWLGVPDLPRPRSTRGRSRLLSRVLPNVRRPAGGVAWQNDRMAYIQVDIFETATRAGRE
jgi:hypothetical protein